MLRRILPGSPRLSPAVSSSPPHMCRAHVCAMNPRSSEREPGPGHQSPALQREELMEGRWSREGALDSCALVATGMGTRCWGGAPRGVRPGAQQAQWGCGEEGLPLCWEQAARCVLPGVPNESRPGPVSSQGPLLSGHLLKAETASGRLDMHSLSFPEHPPVSWVTAVPARLWDEGGGLGVDSASAPDTWSDPSHCPDVTARLGVLTFSGAGLVSTSLQNGLCSVVCPTAG